MQYFLAGLSDYNVYFSAVMKGAELVIYKASAGSGKTYALAKEYLKIVLLHPHDYKSILAVTFTRKATQEMKSRIVEYLGALQQQTPDIATLQNTIIEEIKAEKGVDISAYLRQNAEKALQLILHDYSNFQISTIDSFFQSIIRSFAKELDLPIGMEVELNTDAVLEEGVLNMLRDYHPGKDAFSEWIETYVYHQIEEDKSWKIERNISGFARQLFKEEYQRLVQEGEQVFDIESYKEVLLELQRIRKNYRDTLTKLTAAVEQRIAEEQLDITKYFQGARSVQSFIRKTAAFAPEANVYIQKMLDTGELLSAATKKDKALSQQLEAAWHDILAPYIREVLAFREAHQQAYVSADIVLKNIYALALLEVINAKIKEYKAAQNLILISDTNHIVSLIAQQEEMPFIFEKSATFLKYVMIDEFQDTSAMQWKGVLPLLLEILQQVGGLVLLVGDPKQSIYRWRGGKMELMVDGVSEDLQFHWKERREVPLSANYRSAQHIVDFNNAFFSKLRETIALRNPLFSQVLSDVKQAATRSELPGYVEFKYLEKSERSDDVHLDEVVKAIRELSGVYSYSDIAVLTRDNLNGARVAQRLKEEQIPVVSAESLLLSEQLNVQLCIAAMQVIRHTSDRFYLVKLNFLLARYHQLPSPESYLTAKEEAHLLVARYFPECLDASVALRMATMSADELLSHILHALTLDEKMDSYLWRLQDVVLEHSQRYSASLSDFLEYWEEQNSNLSIVSPEGINAVKLYTIHKSKGLQFPVVILPYANWSMKPKSGNFIWLKSEQPPFDKLRAFPVETQSALKDSYFHEAYEAELEASYIDNVNLLYVAFTRAEEQLYVFSDVKPKNTKSDLPDSVKVLLPFVLDNITEIETQQTDEGCVFGLKRKEKKSTKNAQDVSIFSALPYRNFRKELRLRKRSDYNAAQESGSKVHEVLSRMNRPEDRQKALREVAETPEEAALLTPHVEQIMAFFEQQNWWDDSWLQLSERSLWYGKEQLRADRVLRRGDECVVIDYKTGSPKKQDEEQLKKYMQAYTHIWQVPVKGFLLYTDQLFLKEIK